MMTTEEWNDKPTGGQDEIAALQARVAELEAERDELRAAIFGGGDYSRELQNGNFREMAETLHAAQKGGLARAEAAEAALSPTGGNADG